MKYAYEDLGPDQFENLVVVICRRLFGSAVKGFAKGPDGGRDAKFMGTAELFPSAASPWKGTTIIQAKHTNGYNKSFSETEFYSPGSKNSVLLKEITRIKKLREAGQLDNYILISNRKLTGNTESILSALIASECGMPESAIFLGGVEQLESWLKTYPEVADHADMDPIDSPLIVSPDDLAEVVQALSGQDGSAYKELEDPPTSRIPYEQKNQINNMSQDYAKVQLRYYLKETEMIRGFLSAPENMELQDLYLSAAEEFGLNIVAKRKDYQKFDDVMNHLARLLTDRDPILKKHARLTRTMLFYMYWNCDVGSEEYAETH